MTDPRPSENDRPEFPGMRAAGFFDDLPKLTEGFFTQDELDSVDDTNARHLVAAIDRLTEQLRLSNVIAWQAVTGESNRAIIREGLGLS